MALYELEKISRYYVVNKKKKYVLKDINLTFPNSGLVTILGKSGSGKSTLLNILGKIDEPSEGKILFNHKNLSKFNERKVSHFHSEEVSFIFQHYHLLNNQTALYNVMLPSLISGESKLKAKRKAKELLSSFHIDENLFLKKCCDLSGGERERIAILRAFINEPKVILADEPTGALDKENAILVMESLKKISQDSLVILVTHNNQLANQYSDRIIELHDGKVIKDKVINPINFKDNHYVSYLRKTNTNWTNKIVASNFSKRFKRNIFSVVSIVVGITSCLLIFGFSNGKKTSISHSLEKQFDLGSAYICKENKIANKDSPITLIQSVRPSKEEMTFLNNSYEDINICYSYDALVSMFPTITINNDQIEDISYTPIHSFINKSVNKSLLLKGKIPSFDTLNQVVINKKAYELINSYINDDCLNTVIKIYDEHSYPYYLDDIETPYITDYFVFDKIVQIVGVVEEISFLNTPKIYYSYLALDKYLNEIYLNNLSSYYEEISWKERVEIALDNEDISNYTCRLFLNDISHIDELRILKESIENFSITSNALTVEETMFSLVDAATIGMEIFLVIALVGVSLIVGIISFASYCEDIKDSAILICLGAKRDDVALIFLIESILLGLISVLLSFVLSVILTKPINLLLAKSISLENIIKIPFISFKGRFLLLPFFIITGTLAICALSTYLPISFSKKISLKEELKGND